MLLLSVTVFYYNVRQFESVTVWQKVWQIIIKVASAIRKYGSYYKVRRNSTKWQCVVLMKIADMVLYFLR